MQYAMYLLGIINLVHLFYFQKAFKAYYSNTNFSKRNILIKRFDKATERQLILLLMFYLFLILSTSYQINP